MTFLMAFIIQIFIIRSRNYAEECKECRDPSLRFNAWATQLRRKIAAVWNRWRHCVHCDLPMNRTQNYRTVSDVLNHYVDRAVTFIIVILES